MFVRRLTFVGMVVLVAALSGCGKKDKARPGDTDSPPPGPTPRLPPQPGPGSLPTRPTKEKSKYDFDMMLADMKATAGRKTTGSPQNDNPALNQLTLVFPPGNEKDAIIYKALLETASKLELKDRRRYIHQAVRYAGKENANDLLAIAREYANSPATSREIFQRLAELNVPSTYPLIAAMLKNNDGQLLAEAAKTLRKIGPPAEKAVHPYAAAKGPDGKTNDFVLRTQALQILSEIGTVDSIPMLQMLQKDTSGAIANSAGLALEAIKKRAK